VQVELREIPEQLAQVEHREIQALLAHRGHKEIQGHKEPKVIQGFLD